MADSLFAQAKLTHEAAKYQDQPKDGQQCSGCVQFVAPASCKVGGGSDRCEPRVVHRQARLATVRIRLWHQADEPDAMF